MEQKQAVVLDKKSFEREQLTFPISHVSSWSQSRTQKKSTREMVATSVELASMAAQTRVH
jgi:hypothetical protein